MVLDRVSELENAAALGDREKVINCLQKGFSGLEWACMAACQRGHVEITELLLSEGASNLSDCLYDAGHNKDIDMILMLLKRGIALDPQFSYPTHRITLQTLLSRGVTLDQMSRVSGISDMKTDIANYKQKVSEALSDSISIKDVISIVQSYVLVHKPSAK